jgi:class 3 adenylate cyclase/tetratricopeptide (TPR) repeat protein
VRSCPSCGEENPPRARFCLSCGTQLDAGHGREVRKTVTVVFSDVVGSSGLGERLDPEALRHVMTRYYERAHAVLSRHGGRVQKFIGDAVMAIFGIPAVREDDAVRAVRAAVELHASLSGLNEELDRDFGVRLNLRTGVNTGEIVVGESFGGQDIALGDVVNVAARLEQIAEPGEVLLGDDTYRLARDAVTAELLAPLALKGKGVPVEAWRLLAVKPGAAGHARRLDTPMVGREREMTLVLHAFERTAAEHTSHLVTLLGMAGVGKSRMLHELLSRVGDRATVLHARCLDYGDGMTYWPLVEAVRHAARVSATDEVAEVRRKIRGLLPPAARDTLPEDLGALLGDVDAGGDVADLQEALIGLLRLLAAVGPLIVVLDDLQWADALLLDLVEGLAVWMRDSPVLLVCLARPELREIRPSWSGGMVNATTLLLEPLTAEESSALLHNLLDEAGCADDAQERLVEAAGGNPLYLEELVGMLIEDGLLTRSEQGWVSTADLSRLEVPPTIAALIAARLDGLPAAERAVLERASVVGNVFYRGAVVALSPPEERRSVTEHLLNLVRKELIRPDPSALLGENGLSFRHLLIRDAAYRSLSKRERADLHERCADWLTATFTERVSEIEEVVGYHLEQASRYRTGLGPADDSTVELARRAGNLLAASGRRAFGRRDMPAAVSLLARAAALLPADEEARLALLPDYAAGLVEMGEFERAGAVLEEAFSAADRHGDERLRASALRVRAVLQLLVRPGEVGMEPSLAPVASSASGASAAAEGTGTGTAAGLAAGWTLLQDVGLSPRLSRGAAGDRPAGGTAGPAADRPARDVAAEDDTAIDAFAMTAVLGPTPVRAAVERYTAYLRGPRSNRTLAVRVLAALSGLTAMEGRFGEAREHLAEARSILDQLGLRVRAAALAYLAGLIDLLAEQPADAEEQLRAGCQDCERMGERYVLANLLALRAQATYAQGRYAETVELAEASADAGSEGEALSQVTARGARAKALARLGSGKEAEALAREAVAAAGKSDLLNVHADALADLAEVLSLVGEPEQAEHAAAEALECYQRKGNTVSARRTRAALARLRS